MLPLIQRYPLDLVALLHGHTEHKLGSVLLGALNPRSALQGFAACLLQSRKVLVHVQDHNAFTANPCEQAHSHEPRRLRLKQVRHVRGREFAVVRLLMRRLTGAHRVVLPKNLPLGVDRRVSRPLRKRTHEIK